MQTTKIKPGNYNNIKEVVIQIETTTTVENIETQEASESNVLATLVNLNQRKIDMIAQIDAEIAINNELLSKIRAVDRTVAVNTI